MSTSGLVAAILAAVVGACMWATILYLTGVLR